MQRNKAEGAREDDICEPGSLQSQRAAKQGRRRRVAGLGRDASSIAGTAALGGCKANESPKRRRRNYSNVLPGPPLRTAI